MGPLFRFVGLIAVCHERLGVPGGSRSRRVIAGVDFWGVDGAVCEILAGFSGMGNSRLGLRPIPFHNSLSLACRTSSGVTGLSSERLRILRAVHGSAELSTVFGLMGLLSQMSGIMSDGFLPPGFIGVRGVAELFLATFDSLLLCDVDGVLGVPGVPGVSNPGG